MAGAFLRASRRAHKEDPWVRTAERSKSPKRRCMLRAWCEIIVRKYDQIVLVAFHLRASFLGCLVPWNTP